MSAIQDYAKALASLPTDPEDLLPSLDSLIDGTAKFNSQPFFTSLAMIIISELGDKTFLVAALMAMRHDRLVVFGAAFAALLIMSVLSALLGHTMPQLLPKWLTQLAACGLFFVFGGKMCWEGYNMDSSASVEEEMAEVEQELETVSGSGDSLRSAEEGGINRTDKSSSLKELPRSGVDKDAEDNMGQATKAVRKSFEGVTNLLSLVFSPIFVQTFTLTFLGEWGDRSQIATIAMAAGSDYLWVIVGTVVGHGMCTALAVVGGRLLASKISVRQVTLGGGCLFILFGFLYAYELHQSRTTATTGPGQTYAGTTAGPV
ncbi:Putative uncharacterized protein [Taphrina deformans PYCC 5710]|uniref:GDT1 family protein n=1 Tax=Taphrina deformans (strain PYCC 5710 / ATCC 11124 / CBS 356.35 / IMI 108563 / JCM 9778 / NBRC 8474) TaxID=1097556 RepID=R4XAY4_TAPDE|nr:Putative uncharacterized protein [Taphrina deformans PYCC 5710]|eukprot:CCG83029.1 Putative uncharacterized protein [Taphrina deformans PYCC 5710]